MSIERSFESPNTPLNELLSLVKHHHPSIKSKEVRIEHRTSELLGPYTNHSMCFILKRVVEIPIPGSMLKPFDLTEPSVTLLTYVTINNCGNYIKMITRVPKSVSQYVTGKEEIIITSKLPSPKIGEMTPIGSFVTAKLSYKVQEENPQNESTVGGWSLGILSNVARSARSKMAGMIESTLVSLYQDRRQHHFCKVCRHDLNNLEELETALEEFPPKVREV